VDGVVEEALVQ